MGLPVEGCGLDARLVEPGTRDYVRALHLAHGVDPPAGGQPAQQIADLLANAQRGLFSVGLLFGAYVGDALVSACLGVEAPGRAALVLVPGNLPTPIQCEGAVAALRTLQEAAWRRSVALLEVLVAPQSHTMEAVLQRAGFRNLTRLRYLRRCGPRISPSCRAAKDLEWVSYNPALESLFRQAVECTYVQSQDCPELAGLRPTADVLAGHRATGIFDPACWWVAARRKEPVGVILLNGMRRVQGLEVVYMGVAQPSRGTGVADALLSRAVEAAVGFGDSILALAVDERNAPARRMYARWGFMETGVQVAWIATPPRI